MHLKLNRQGSYEYLLSSTDIYFSLVLWS